MKIIGMLAWYDEPVEALARCVASCAGFVDVLVAVDGRYQLYRPGAPAQSPVEQVEAIKRAAAAAGLRLVLHTKTKPWASEGEKRTKLFELAEQAGDPFVDWVIPIDADEELVVGCVDALRAKLASTSFDRFEFLYETPHPEGMSESDRAVMVAGTDIRTVYLTRLLRLYKNMVVQPPTHWAFTGVDKNGCVVSLRVPDATLPADELHILHRTTERGLQRMIEKAAYVQARTETGEL
jgi:hypothetical protein